jgi:hypothetical protein
MVSFLNPELLMEVRLQELRRAIAHGERRFAIERDLRLLRPSRTPRTARIATSLAGAVTRFAGQVRGRGPATPLPDA